MPDTTYSVLDLRTQLVTAGAKRTIPHIRTRLLELAAELRDPAGLDYGDIADEIEELCEESKRRFGGRRAKPRQKRLDPELKARIRSYADAHPDANFMEMAEALDTNSGRISEALTGFRGDRA